MQLSATMDALMDGVQLQVVVLVTVDGVEADVQLVQSLFIIRVLTEVLISFL